MSNTIHADRQKEVAALALTAERVHTRMLARLKATSGAVLTVSRDEFAEIGMTMVALYTASIELHAILASGMPSRDELIALCTNISGATQALTDASKIAGGIAARVLVKPTAEETIDG